MLKHLFVLFGSIALPILFSVIVFNIWFDDTPTQPAIVVNIEADMAQFEAELAEQEAVYQAELNTLIQILQAQQRHHEARQRTLNSQVAAAQEQLAGLRQKKQALQSQLAQLVATQAEQRMAHENQLQQLHAQYDPELNQLQTQLTEAKRGQPQP
jgi:hypothetical protein